MRAVEVGDLRASVRSRAEGRSRPRRTRNLGFLLATLFATAAEAATVTSLDDDGPGSLRQTIADASPGETIDFAVGGTITLTGGALVITKDVTLAGPGSAALSIRGGGDRVMTIGGAEATLSGLTIERGFTRDRGGGVLVAAGATLIVTDCTFTDNRAVGERGNQTILRVQGGAISNAGTTRIANCTFERNYALGSADGSFGAELSGVGGAIYNDAPASLSIDVTTFYSNGATGADSGSRAGDGFGGAIYSRGTAEITNSTFSGNFVFGGGSPIPNQSGVGSGGAIYNLGTLSLTNCTISGNSAGYFGGGGGLVSRDGGATLKQVILAGNAIGDCFGALVSAGHNLIGVRTDCSGFTDGVNGDRVGGQGTPGPGKTRTPGADETPGPLDPLLAPLADNGGATQTRAPLLGSPAIDGGDLADCSPTDQRGAPRPVDGNGDGTSSCDIGAFEVQPGTLPTVTPTTTNGRSGSPTRTPTSTDTPVPPPTATSTSTTGPAASPSHTPTLTGTPQLPPTATRTAAPTDSATAATTSTPGSTDTPTSGAAPTSTYTLPAASRTAPGGGDGCELAPSAGESKVAAAWLLAPMLLQRLRRRGNQRAVAARRRSGSRKASSLRPRSAVVR